MPTPIVMPQMGESIVEGTIVRWIKKVGDQVDRDEPLFEITTDKVDAEIPSPSAGILTEILAKEGDTVSVHSIVGTIQLVGEQPGQDARPITTQPPALEPPPGTTPAPRKAPTASGEAAGDDHRRQKSSPLVRRIARENNVDVARITGSGLGGRVTKQDILGYLGSGVSEQGSGDPPPLGESLSRVETKPLSAMRKKIAEHMVLSRRTSAHVHTVFHVNFSEVERIRRAKKDEYDRLGVKLSYMAFIARAVIDALRRHPIVNASLDGDSIVYKKDVNLGIAVALESGLIVPVIKQADEKNLLGLTRAIADVAARARAKQLKPEEVHGGTFTITNPGQLGAQFGMPIISQPQVAILGVGTIEKRPVVVDDGLAIRTMAYLTLGYDHRLIDGAVADQFMSDIRRNLEHFDPNQV
ncbi:MAG: dihydrolipoamide acetyltransferase family protein [Acidobacteria bacterium]|nr:dihydrolipoamide acetyltransferase family protein [Acidobacteriota bacterium]